MHWYFSGNYTAAAMKVGNMANLYGGEGKMRFANLWT